MMECLVKSQSSQVHFKSDSFCVGKTHLVYNGNHTFAHLGALCGGDEQNTGLEVKCRNSQEPCVHSDGALHTVTHRRFYYKQQNTITSSMTWTILVILMRWWDIKIRVKFSVKKYWSRDNNNNWSKYFDRTIWSIATRTCNLLSGFQRINTTNMSICP